MNNWKARINHQIRASELRVIGSQGENLGILTLSEALKKSEELGLDLIEISPNANPPIARISDFGKYQYEENKKQKQAKSKSRSVEVKNIQIKIGTGEHDLGLKAKKAGEWLSEKHRVKIDLFLPGRTKYLEQNFLKDRMDRILKLLPVEYKIAEPPKKSPKGMTIIIEKK
ncbi:MAG: translation initiation factor IF-3 [Candidatus Paceibacterota bacterium]|nr:MAG: translation initiation factor IF-3 [Candidatus Paceibacterota bacterium]